MPQARLPDINAAFTKHRNEVIGSIRSQSYDNVFGALYALNALLPEEPIVEETGNPKYRVVVSDIDYRNLTKPTVKCRCYHCSRDSLYDDVKVFDMLLPLDLPKPPRRQEGLMDRSSYHRKVTQWAWTMLDELENKMAQFRDDNWTKKDSFDGDEVDEDSGET